MRPMVALVGGAVAIGFAPIFVRWTEVGLNATAFWRLALALPALWLLCRRNGGAVVPRQGGGMLAFAGLCFALDLCFWHASIALTTVANATLLANLTPVVVVLFYWLVIGQRPTWRFAAGATLALAGAAGLALGSRQPSGGGGSVLLGDLYGAITAVAYAGYLLAVERARGTAGGFQVMLASTAVATLVTGAVALASGENFWPASGMGWAVLAGLALLVHVLGQGGIVWAVGQLPATLSSVVILIQPVVAAGLGWLWLGEALGLADILCGFLVLAGVVTCQSRRAPGRNPAPGPAEPG
ncbi:MAG: DMT family transporter [Chromatiales bacterium]|nr:DMT family transporter [Chromatiales bacterium]